MIYEHFKGEGGEKAVKTSSIRKRIMHIFVLDLYLKNSTCSIPSSARLWGSCLRAL